MSQSELEPDRGTKTSTPPGTPRWVKVFGIVALVVILLLVILLLIGPGSHGPGMHSSLSGGVATPRLAIVMDPGGR